ncbi:MAG TPA: hypothetical protein VG056_17640 [Pirellulales bacterium]|nr:hypothetical protein [Pirellulales bacterium]
MPASLASGLWTLAPFVDFDVQRFSRCCIVSGRELAPGETFYSALIPSGANVVRQDYSAEAWQGPPADALGWWKSQVPTAETKKSQWAPNDMMLDLFDQLADQPDRADMRYVLALLLVRRRVLRLEETEKNEQQLETLLVYCPRREADYRVPVIMPDAARAGEIQQLLAQLLFRAAA